jgi:hypothetical protein
MTEGGISSGFTLRCEEPPKEYLRRFFAVCTTLHLRVPTVDDQQRCTEDDRSEDHEVDQAPPRSPVIVDASGFAEEVAGISEGQERLDRAAEGSEQAEQRLDQ